MTTTDTRAPEVPTPDEDSKPAPIAVIAVAVVIGIGLLFRFVIHSDLWLDEALSVNIAHLPVGQIPHWLRHDGAPPLYYVLLHYWEQAFGTSDLAVRSLSGIFGVASLPLAYCCARRIGGRSMGWIAVLVLVASPYAIIYSTSSRMYALEMFLVFAAILAVRRAFDAPTLGRLAVVTLLTALLIYTQYWAFYLLIATGIFLLGTARRSDQYRGAAVRLIAAIAIGVLTFLPWIPTFLYQAKHTGTPWGVPLLPPIPIGTTFQDFAGGGFYEGWVLFFVIIVLVVLGVFGATVDSVHIDLDLRTQPGARWEATVGVLTLVVGTTLAWASGSTFQSRYAAVMFPFFVIVVARGITLFADPHVRTWVLIIVIGLGFAGGVRNVSTDRTEAGEVARIIRKEAKPGDMVVFCPDQLGPAVSRLTKQKGLDEVTYPVFRKPQLVDWVDYKDVLKAHKPTEFARQAVARAGDHTIWYVSAPGYRTHTHTCDALSDALATKRPMVDRLNSSSNFYEKPGLQEFPAR